MLLFLFLALASGFAGFLIDLLCWVIIVAVAYFIVKSILPEPLKPIGIAVIVVLAAIAIIYLLQGFPDGGFPRFR